MSGHSNWSGQGERPKRTKTGGGKSGPGTPMSIAEARNSSNPHYRESVASGDTKYTQNCNRCWIAYEENRKGYRVEARPTFTGDRYGAFYEPNSYRVAYENSKWIEVAKRAGGRRTAAENSRREMERVMLAEGEGSRFGVRIRWKGGGGHVFNAEVKDGKVIFVDAQTHRMVNPMDYLSNASLGNKSNLQVCRVDNRTLTESARKIALIER